MINKIKKEYIWEMERYTGSIYAKNEEEAYKIIHGLLNIQEAMGNE